MSYLYLVSMCLEIFLLSFCYWFPAWNPCSQKINSVSFNCVEVYFIIQNMPPLYECVCVYTYLPLLRILLRQNFTLSPGLEYRGTVLAHYNLRLLDPSNSSASASQVAGIKGVCHHAWLIFVFLVETGFCHVGQDGLELMTSGDLPASASQSAGITGVSHLAQPHTIIFRWWFWN